MSGIKLTTLDNGLRIITDHVPSVHSAAVGIWISAGTRNEDMVHNGAAHMVEHMLFKGTKTRTALDIAGEIENAGGNMNAYTSREVTSYHAHVLKDDVNLALDVLGDMVQNSTLPDDEVERERQVILQEIGMCADTPDDLVFDHFYETAWPDQALGAPILGTAKIIENMKRDALNAYIRKNYTHENIVVSVAGFADHDAVVDKVQSVLDNLPSSASSASPSVPASNYTGGDNRIEKELEQAHIVLGFQSPSRLDDEYYSARALSAVLGGGMSSRLFQEVREKRGLVYSVYSFASAYCDDGIFGIYAGTGPEKLTELIPVVADEVRKISTTVAEDEIARVRTRMKAGILMARESMMNRADSQAKYLIYHGTVIAPDVLITKVDGINKAGVQAAANQIFTSCPTISALGPLSHLEGYDDIARRLAA